MPPMGFSQLNGHDLWCDGRDDVSGQLLLEFENMVQFAVVFFCPDVRTGSCVNELRRDPYAVAHLTHAAFQDITNAQFTANGADVRIGAFVGEAGVACDHEQRFET